MRDYGNPESGNREFENREHEQLSAEPSGLLRSPAPIVAFVIVLGIAIVGLLVSAAASGGGQSDGQELKRSLAGVSAESPGLAGPALAVTSAAATTAVPPTSSPQTTIPVTSATTAPPETVSSTTTAGVTSTVVAENPNSSAEEIPSSNGADDSAVRTAVLQLTNAERAKVDCPALVENSQLLEAADGHAEDMAINDYFSHSSQDGRGLSDRVRDAGFTGGALGEIIAAGQQTPEGAVSSWMNSDGHRQGIQTCGYTQVGIGYGIRGNTRYWVQVFGG